MFSKKKTECRVCGYRFTPERENIYTAEEPRSMADMLTKAPTRFSAVDCPICGCQIALAIRVPRVDISDNAERHDADALNIPASPYPDGDKGVLACPNCGSGEYLHNADENENAFCGQCGQAIKWGCEFSLSEKERREREARDRFTFTEPEQCSLNVDPDTGEVVEESEVADE